MKFMQLFLTGSLLIDAICFWRVALVVQGDRYLPGFLVACSLVFAGLGLMFLFPVFRGLPAKSVFVAGISLSTCVAVWLAVSRVHGAVH